MTTGGQLLAAPAMAVGWPACSWRCRPGCCWSGRRVWCGRSPPAGRPDGTVLGVLSVLPVGVTLFHPDGRGQLVDHDLGGAVDQSRLVRRVAVEGHRSRTRSGCQVGSPQETVRMWADMAIE
jgi:hypothetical protein